MPISSGVGDEGMNLEEYLEEIWRLCYKFMEQFPGHDVDHVRRVYENCLLILERETGDPWVVLPAAILHDIARGKENHAIESGKMAEKLLKEIKYPEDKIPRIVRAIESHSFSGNRRPLDRESKILWDADNLDAIGAVGIARAFLYSGANGRGIRETIEHFKEKLLRLKDMMYTETGKEIAKRRHEFMLNFLRELESEL